MRSSPAELPPSALLPSRAALATLLDGVDEPLLLFDDLGRLSFANRAAMRALGAEPGLGVAQLARGAGRRGGGLAARAACVDAADAASPLQLTLADARRARLSCWRVGRDLALRVQLDAPDASTPASLPAVESGPTLEMLRMLWASPFPATLQDAEFRLVDVNEAYRRLHRPRARGAGRPRPGRAAAAGRPGQRSIERAASCRRSVAAPGGAAAARAG